MFQLSARSKTAIRIIKDSNFDSMIVLRSRIYHDVCCKMFETFGLKIKQKHLGNRQVWSACNENKCSTTSNN